MTHTTEAPTLTLSDGVAIPRVGLGVWQVPDADVGAVVRTAIAAGYRSIDTAAAYDNEGGVGDGLRTSGVPREELFVTTKLANSEQGYETATAAFHESLSRLGLDHLDLYLIHWPMPARDRYVDTWRALVDLQRAGLVRSIGVSNFQPAHLRRLVEETGVTPTVNQVELHPRFQQAELRAVHAELGIATEAWSPLGQGRSLDDPALAAVASRYGVSAAQVVLRWHLQLGTIVIPKSVTPARIVQNIDLFDFELDDADMAAIAALDSGTRLGPHPDDVS